MKRLLLVLSLLFFALPSYADTVCVDCDASSVTSDLVDAGDFPGADIGAKINAAQDEFSATKAGTIIVPPDLWCGESYSTMIVVDTPVHISFPGSKCQAVYTGASAAIKITGAGTRSKITGFGVDETGNANANVDGILLDATDAQLVDCVFEWFCVENAVRHGINLEAKDNGIYRCAFQNGHVITPGGNNVLIDSTGTAKANNVSFTQVGIDTPPDSFNGIRVADGYANSFKDIYIQSGAATAWGIYTTGEYEYFENITLDNTMELGFKIDAGFAVINGIRNNATGTAETISGTGKLTKIDYSGNVVPGVQFLSRDGATAAPGYSFANNTNTGIYNSSGVMTLTVLGVDVEAVGLNHSFRAAGCFRWSSTSAPAGAADVILCRAAAGSLSLTSVEAADAIFNLWADEGDDTADKFSWTSSATNILTLKNGTTALSNTSATGEVDFVGISSETDNVVCVKSDGKLGTCTSVVGVDGTCTCS